MPALAWEDLDVFLDADRFASVVVIHLGAGEIRQVTGIFDDPFLDAKLGEYDLSTTQPRFLAKAIDLDGIDRGDTLVVDGETFDILEPPRPDGTGLATLAMARRHA